MAGTQRKQGLVWCKALVLILASLADAGVAAERPNIVLFIGDNWAWPHAGALGDPTAKTPVFDRLAREGVLFEHTFCPVPSCSPTRSCILTGRVSHQLADAANLWSKFPQDLEVFTELLRRTGYEIGYCGKGWAPGRHAEYGWPENPVGPKFESLTQFLSQRDPAKPFFFWNGNTDTALNKWRYEQEGWSGLDPHSIVVPAYLPDVQEVRQSLLAYYGAVGRMDAAAGECRAVLERSNLLEDTVVVYTSDNGWQMPRGLANCYDTGVRVPLAVRWGSRLKPGHRVEAFISLTDLAPTFLELAGVARPAIMTGRSFVDILLGQSSAVPRDHVFLERERHANVRRGDLSYPMRAIRTKDFLYLWNLRPSRWPAGDPQAYHSVGDFGDVDGSRAKLFLLEHQTRLEYQRFLDWSFYRRPEEELYDLAADPQQLRNVATSAEYATVRRDLRQRVEQWMQTTGDPRVDPRYDAWDTYPYFGPRVVDEQGQPIPKRPASK